MKFSEKIKNFKHFGQFPLLEIKNPESLKSKKTSVAIIGFGRFGQFIGEQMVSFGFDVYATSRTNYTKLANELGIIFLDRDSFLSLNIENAFDVIILATSILSFEKVLTSYPKELWENKLIVDVLSVKLYPQEIINKYLSQINCDILLTHPMFGPDSAKSSGLANSWNNKNFVFWKEKINNNELLNRFISFWEYQGCNMIEMSPQEHDKLTANSQFLTHFLGRTLELLDCQNTKVDTDGYKSLVTIKNHSVNDSWDLFYALAKYNPLSIDTINKLKYQISILEEKILYPDGKIIKQSETGKMNSKIINLKSEGKKIINSAIGVPSWYPQLPYTSSYSTAKGNKNLLNQMKKYYSDKHNLEINDENLVIVSGAKPGIYLSLKLLTRIGTKWILPKPYWTSYPDMIELENGSSILLDSKVENNWSLNLSIIEENFKDKLVNGIIICQPNNPTGLLYNENFIEQLIILAKNYDKYIIMDEVYLSLTDSKTSYKLAKTFEFSKLIVVSSFSKYWAVPGWRVGWVLSEPNIISQIVKLQSNILTCASNSGQEVCCELLDSNFSPDLSILSESKDVISKIFIDNGWSLPKNDELSMYLFPVNNEINIHKVVNQLLENGLGVISGTPFGYDNAIRITLPNNYEDLEDIKNILIKVLPIK